MGVSNGGEFAVGLNDTQINLMIKQGVQDIFRIAVNQLHTHIGIFPLKTGEDIWQNI